MGDSDGRVLDDRYELGELIGSGGMAEVWRARDRRLGRDVAVKLLSGPGARDESSRRRIEREARALAAASHPNIVAVYDYGEEPDDDGLVPYIVMELVDGPDLHQFLAGRGPLPVDEAQAIMSGILAAVGFAHASGIVHGDLKPANVFVGAHGPKVGDFGVARILGEETGTTTVAATPTFAAPEVLKGGRATAASDVYSAACLAYELLAGRPPYVGANGWEVAQKHLESPAPKLRKVRSDAPREVDAAIQRGMEKEPRKRFASAAAFAEALAGSSSGASVPASPPVSATVPIAAGATEAVAAGGHTEVIGGTRPDVARVALLGPLAGWWERIRGAKVPRRRWIALAVLAVLALAVAGLALRDGSNAPVAVPDVTGKKVPDAESALRLNGFKVTDVLYRAITEGEPNRVLETIPASDEMVEPGSDVRLVASALAVTPAPSIAPAAERNTPARAGKHGRGKKRNKD